MLRGNTVMRGYLKNPRATEEAFRGETVCAFVTQREGAGDLTEEVTAWCRERIARYKTPRTVVFGPLPKTSTGKVRKFTLRERAKAL